MSLNTPTRLLTIFFFFTAFVWGVTAQYEEKDFVRFTVKDGLSDHNVSCITQDQKGYLWIGTEIGLNRFDGNQFKNSYQGFSGHLLPSSHIRKLIMMDSNRLIIVTTNGFQVLNNTIGTHQNYSIPDTTPFVTLRNLVWDVKALGDGSFAATTSSGFYVFRRNGSISFRYDAYGLKDIGNKRIFYGRNIFTVPGNQLLAYIEESDLAHFRPQNKTFTELDSSGSQWKDFFHPPVAKGGGWLSRNQISGHEYIFIPRNDSIIYYNYEKQKRISSPLPFPWKDELTYESLVHQLDDSTFTLNGGFAGFYIFHLDRNNGRININPHKYLNAYKINSIFQDKDDRLWIGTTRGLLRQNLNPGIISSYHWPVGDFSIHGYKDGIRYKDKLYLCRLSSDVGLVIIDTATMKIERELSFYGTKNEWNEISTMAMYYPDTIWLGSSKGLLWFDIKSASYGKLADRFPGLHVPQVTVLHPVRDDGYAWMCGALNGIVARYDISKRRFETFTLESNPALPFPKIKDLAYDAFGDVWVSGHSLARWNNQQEKFDTLITVYGGVNKFNDDINVITADADGSLWLHNSDNGLLEYRIKDRQFISYTMNDGLPSDVIRSFSPVVDQTLWIGSHNHLTRFDTRTKKMEVYGYHDGLPEQKPISRKIIADHESKQLYMFYTDEVIRFPMHPVTNPDHGSGLVFEELLINDQHPIIFPKEKLQLKYVENNISIAYTIIDFEDNQNYKFAYKLNGAAEWIAIGDQRMLHLNNLSPGTYTLQIKATGRSGVPKVNQIVFAIAPPFWKTGWFFILCAVVLLIGIYLIYRSRLTHFRQKANIDKLLSQTEMKALHAQMNPHFIFNSLNSIREMILMQNNNEASRFLSKFAHLIRITLDQSGQPYISLRNTVDYLERYIEMEKIRNNKFTCEIIVDPALEPDETILPPMLIQPFIENSIWHGATGNEKKIDIIIRFQKKADQLICIIEDNGIGIERSLNQKILSDTSHRSVGIANIESRILLLNKKHNLQSSITVEDKSKLNGQHETGTKVTLRLPLEIAFV